MPDIWGCSKPEDYWGCCRGDSKDGAGWERKKRAGIDTTKNHGSKTPPFLLRFYYDWLPRFAAFCRDLQFFLCHLTECAGNESLANRGISRHNVAYLAHFGGLMRRISILFVCHGSIWLNGQKPSIYAGFRPPGQDFYQRFINIRKRAFRCDK